MMILAIRLGYLTVTIIKNRREVVLGQEELDEVALFEI